MCFSSNNLISGLHVAAPVTYVGLYSKTTSAWKTQHSMLSGFLFLGLFVPERAGVGVFNESCASSFTVGTGCLKMISSSLLSSISVTCDFRLSKNVGVQTGVGSWLPLDS